MGRTRCCSRAASTAPATRPSLRARDAGASAEDLKVAEKVPENDEDDDGAQAAAAELFGAPTSRYTSQKLAHDAR